MTHNRENYEKGVKGEDRAASHLKKNRYDILQQRFRSRTGEVDIIARKDNVIVFVEVKNWDVLGKESLEHSISLQKQTRIRKTAEYFLLRYPEFEGYQIRFDLIFLSRRMEKLEHLKSAF